MSSIKPANGGSPPVGQAGDVSGPSSPDSTAAERAGGPSFREALEQARGADPTSAASGVHVGEAARAGASDPIAELAAAVRSGAIGADQALERLVDRAVAGVGARLTAAQREELATVLRHALDHDPALRELRDALE